MEELSAVFFPLKKIAIILQLDYQELTAAYMDQHSQVYMAIERGKLKQEAELRKIIFNLARGGSSPAQNMALKIIDRERIEGY